MSNSFTDIEIYTGAEPRLAAQAPQVSSEAGASSAAEQQKAIAEVQASLIIAASHPRNELTARVKLLKACQRPGLARAAVYEYKRGGSRVTGPSVRLAEAAARCFGNLTYGFRELTRRPGESEVEAYCWDLESNTRASRIFTVRHVRDVAQSVKTLTQERDIYEMIAGQAQRRVRACILEVVPADIIEDAVYECGKTLNAVVKDLGAAIAGLIPAFEELGVSKSMLEERMGHKLESCSAAEILEFRRIWTAIKDGFGTVPEYFKASAEAEKVPDEPKRKGKKADKTPAQPETPAPVQEQTKPAPAPKEAEKPASSPAPAPAPEPEPVKAEPVQKQEPAVPDSRASADIDEAYFDYCEGNGMDISKADGVCRQLVSGGACKNMTEARKIFVEKQYTV